MINITREAFNGNTTKETRRIRSRDGGKLRTDEKPLPSPRRLETIIQLLKDPAETEPLKTRDKELQKKQQFYSIRGKATVPPPTRPFTL